MRKLFLLLLFSIVGLTAIAFDRRYSVEIIPNPYGKSYIYRVVLKDKAGTPYSITSPEKFLSLKSVERRRRQGIAIDSTDLPVSPDYIRAIGKRGLSVVGKSKWNNTLLVKGPNRQELERLRLLKLPPSRITGTLSVGISRICSFRAVSLSSFWGEIRYLQKSLISQKRRLRFSWFRIK